MSDLLLKAGIIVPERELHVQFSRSAGPGGQNVNKVATKVELRFAPARSTAFTEAQKALLLSRLRNRLTKNDELIVVSDRTRNQARNREDARKKLTAILETAFVRDKPRRPTRPNRAAIRRRLSDKKHRSSLKQGRRSSEDDQ